MKSYILAHVPATEMRTVADDLKAIFAVKREETARQLAQQFSERYGKRFSKAVDVLRRGLEQALNYLRFPSSHQRLLRSTNSLERLFVEVKRRTRVVGVFSNVARATWPPQ
jgi:transposase-like protein